MDFRFCVWLLLARTGSCTPLFHESAMYAMEIIDAFPVCAANCNKKHNTGIFMETSNDRS